MNKQTIKNILYDSGVFERWHRIRNAHNLTTVMFHRVLPKLSPQFARADPIYTIEAGLFQCCLDFFHRYYNTVSLIDLADAIAGKRPLPQRPLLITFDDGWRDTLTVAGPMLCEAKLPAVCFIATSALSDPRPAWWQETFSMAWREGRVDGRIFAAAAEDVDGLAQLSENYAGSYIETLAIIGSLGQPIRDALFDRLAISDPVVDERHMLSPSEVEILRTKGISIGAHGTTHIPLTLSEDAEREMTQSRIELASVCRGRRQDDVIAMSFPHGRYTPELLKATFECGYDLVFTSDAHLTSTSTSAWTTRGLGRIVVSATDIVDRSGVFSPARCAWHLFNRPVA